MTSTAAKAEREYWLSCNHTELYQAARTAGMPVRPNMSREELAAYLSYERRSLPTYPHALDSLRLGIARFVIDHKRELETLIKCPLKSFDPRACFECPDTLTIHCLTSNTVNAKAIQSRRYNNQEEPIDMTTDDTIQTFPRDIEGISAKSPFMHRKVMIDLGYLPDLNTRAAWTQLSPEDRVKQIADALAAYDKSNGVVQPPPAAAILPPPNPSPPSGPVARLPEPAPSPPSVPPPPPAPAPAPTPATGEARPSAAQLILDELRGYISQYEADKAEERAHLNTLFEEMRQLRGVVTGLRDMLTDVTARGSITLELSVELAKGMLMMGDEEINAVAHRALNQKTEEAPPPPAAPEAAAATEAAPAKKAGRSRKA